MMMSGSKLTHKVLFFLLIFCVASSFKLSYCIGDGSIIFCPEIEKQALVNFKQSLEDPSNLLSSWNIGLEVNCCKWKGVVCSNLTGHVHQLHLQNYDQLQAGLSGKINHSLLNLKQLKYLDLSQNNFSETIPSFIGSFTSLEYLNLSLAGFHGKIPHSLGNLSNLHTLSLEAIDNYYEYPRVQSLLDVDRLEWLSGLSQLEHLNMNNVNLSKAASNWVQVINTLPSLVELHFHGCSLNFMAPLAAVNVTSLALLDLSRNNEFHSFVQFPRWIFQLSTLVHLDLSFNNFEGPIPSTINTTQLKYIDLSVSRLNSSIPDWLYFCKDLEVVNLIDNSLQNTISKIIGNLTSLNTLFLSENELSGKIPREIANLCKMQSLDLSFNKLQSEISDSFGNMSDCFLAGLKELILRRNQLSGQITNQFGEFKSLEWLDLSGNKLTGNLPESMGQLFNLESLRIGYNMLEGVVTETHFANLTKLRNLGASGNRLSLKVSRNWIPPFKLEMLEMRSWNFGAGSPIPSWIEHQKSIFYLDLSDTRISGNVPSWVMGIQYLNLSHNQLHGKIPDIVCNPDVYDCPDSIFLSSNQFSGSLPRLANVVRELDLSNNSLSGGLSHFLCDVTNETYRLEILHLAGNQLTGELPDCWTKWPSLTYLNLGDNKMFGNIPNSIGFLENLISLNLYGNNFSGQIPFSMHNCTQLVKIDLGGNYLVGNIPTWMGTSLADLRFLILRSNKLSGEISSDICHLNSLQILDLSNNNFSGIIPGCVNNFSAMANKSSFVEYSYSMYGVFFVNGQLFYTEGGVFKESVVVATKGREYQYDIILSLFTNIDLSNNNLSGEIPMELTSLVELRSMNLSGNHLTGLIPESIGDMKQLESLDFSRNSLSGELPNSFTTMSSLNYLNLSYNNFTGRIPECTQLMGMNAWSFVGNNLCGLPLPNKCSKDDDDDAHGPLQKEDNIESEIEWLYVFLFLGYTVGFSTVCSALVLKKSWREAYFGWLELMWDNPYVYFYCKWARLTNARVV